MIKLEDLKPIIEPLCPDDKAVEIIEAIQAIDTHTTEADVAAAVAEADAAWNKKFKDTFFGGAAAAEPAAEEVEEAEVEEVDEDVDLDDLIYPDGK